MNLLIKLGFEIHGQKSILKLTQELEFLGFVINPKSMTISMNKEKSEHIILKVKKSLK